MSAPGDRFEREADRAAASVMATADTKPVQVADRAPRLQRQAAEGAKFGDASAVHDVDRALSGTGKALTPASRALFERRFGENFSHVRIHDGAEAAASATAVGARAYTAGSDIVFGRGEYEPATETGRTLLAHELAHVVQQREGDPVIQRQMICASGFAKPYATDAAEISSFKAGTWWPSTDDFIGTVSNSGGGLYASTLDELFGQIQSQERHGISELGLVGHAVNGAFVLSGTIKVEKEGGVTFDDDVGVISTKSVLARKDYLWLRDRFADGAAITLYGCHSGADQELLDTLSQVFGVCVHGFTQEIQWCVASSASHIIVSRGKTKLGLPEQSCGNYFDDIRNLAPDAHSCAGAPGGAAPSGAAPPQTGG